MTEKEYKCGYIRCIRPHEKVKASEAVLIGKKRYHKECAELRNKIEVIKRIYFDYIDDKSDYVQVLGVINSLIFKKGYEVDFVEFVMKYTAIYCYKVSSPYLLHKIANNGITDRMYKDNKKRMEVNRKFDNRTRINSTSKRKVR